MGIFDFTDGDFLMDMGSGMAMDLETGDLHLTDSNSSCWDNSDDDNDW